MGAGLTWDKDSAVAHLCARDMKLAQWIERVGPCRLELRVEHSVFFSLLRAIVYQQLAGKAAAAILARVVALFPAHPLVIPEDIVDAPDALLRSAGLSRNKMAAIRDLAAKTIDGTVPTLTAIRRMPDEEIIARLTEVRGIGVWTVQMLLIFRLGRPDILPVTDYGVRKGFALTFLRLPKTKPFDASMLATIHQIERRAEKWRPWRSVASWYLWRACDLAGKAMVLPH